MSNKKLTPEDVQAAAVYGMFRWAQVNQSVEELPTPLGSKDVYLRVFDFETGKFTDWEKVGEITGPGEIKFVAEIDRPIAEGIIERCRFGYTASEFPLSKGVAVYAVTNENPPVMPERIVTESQKFAEQAAETINQILIVH